MSKKNKVVKLASKNRDRGEDYFVTYNGVRMTRFEREAMIRAARKGEAPAQDNSAKKAKKGTKVAEPSHSKLFNALHPNKKQTVAPDLKSVEAKAPVEEKKAKPAPEPKKAEPKPEPKKEEPKPEPKPVVEEKKPEPKKEEPKKEEPAVVYADEDEDDDALIEDDGEEDDLSEELNLRNAKKRISPNFVKRVAKTSGAACDECINNRDSFQPQIEAIEADIKKAKTPKDANEGTRAELNELRKDLRAKKKKLETERDVNNAKAVALEHAADGYCDVFKLLTGKVLIVRKTERINPYVPLTEEQELEVLNSFWADKSARRAPKKKA